MRSKPLPRDGCVHPSAGGGDPTAPGILEVLLDAKHRHLNPEQYQNNLSNSRTSDGSPCWRIPEVTWLDQAPSVFSVSPLPTAARPGVHKQTNKGLRTKRVLSDR
ncbi:uncharacterized protein LOC111527542 [Piliocolobus tephrosceles]|uniref:uncharacterized protein LOC111527542 n=1 Tax=Piliocolobus tephrosceles TaxID=591936 RepID=UPI000C2A2D3F|nr:uncharacterized protein LOC111527542 [Piliocolobus tephrosceles]